MNESQLEKISAAKGKLSQMYQAVREAEAKKSAQSEREQAQAEQRLKRAESRVPKTPPVPFATQRVEVVQEESPTSREEEGGIEVVSVSADEVMASPKRLKSKGKKREIKLEDSPKKNKAENPR